MSDKQRDILGALAAIGLGLCGFSVLIGWTTLIPTNIGWLDFADRAMHTLGWMFFRQTPWGVPPGVSPRLGLELANSIGLVDGLPLLALPAKLLSPWLPYPVQYWGLWLLCCFVLQALFAWLIARELGAGRILALIAAGFALITPAYMFRIEMHLALSGHWTILAALWLYTRRTAPPRWAWPLLVALTAGIHAYLLAMVMALWLAAFAERLLDRRMSWRGALLELAAGAGAALLILWAAGFFVSGTTGTYGYGAYKLNLLWPFLTYKGWSQIVPDLPHTNYDYEGLSFLGIGVLALIALSIATGAVAQLRAIASRRWMPLALALLLLMMFALSKDIAFADHELFAIPLPDPIDSLASTFRSTGRFVWPLLYVVTIGAVVLIGTRLRAAFAIPLALAAVVAQAADSGPALLTFAERLPPVSDHWESPLQSPFWQRAAAAGYTRIRVIPVVSNPGTDWKALGYFAATHDMAIDSVYLGRVDAGDLAALRAHEQKVLDTGAFEPGTLYILDPKSALVAQPHVGPGDLLARIDDRIVLAKGGAHLADGLELAPVF